MALDNEKTASEMESIAEMTRETIGANLLKLLLKEIKRLPSPWEKLSEDDQNFRIDRMREGIIENVHTAVQLLEGAGRICVAANLGKISVNGETTTSNLYFNSENSRESMTAIHFSSKKPCLVIVSNVAEHLQEMMEIKGDPTQKEIFTEDKEKQTKSGTNFSEKYAEAWDRVTGDGSGHPLPPIDQSSESPTDSIAPLTTEEQIQSPITIDNLFIEKNPPAPVITMKRPRKLKA